jgi:hypothetical protein
MRLPLLRGSRPFCAAILLLLALVTVPSSAFATRTLGLSAGSFRFDVQAGQPGTGVVVVMNDGTEPMSVMVYASDQSVDDKGNITYKTPTRADLSSLNLPSAWTTIKMPANSKSLGNIPYLELKPGQRVPVKFTVNVPAGVVPGDHNVVLFFESFVVPKPGQGAQSNVSGRLGARVTMRVAGEFVRKLEVHPFNVPAYVIGGIVPWEFVVHNTGNLDQRVGARVLLMDRNENELAQQQAIDGNTIFAGTAKEATGTLQASTSAVGPHTVRLDVSPVDEQGKATSAGADTITQTRQVWLIPYWLIATVVVLILILIAGIIWAIVRGSKRRRAARDAEVAAATRAQLGATQQRPYPDSEYEK